LVVGDTVGRDGIAVGVSVGSTDGGLVSPGRVGRGVGAVVGLAVGANVFTYTLPALSPASPTAPCSVCATPPWLYSPRYMATHVSVAGMPDGMVACVSMTNDAPPLLVLNT
jgi:hypothetical protein